jgi:hypothetical protein
MPSLQEALNPRPSDRKAMAGEDTYVLGLQAGWRPIPVMVASPSLVNPLQVSLGVLLKDCAFFRFHSRSIFREGASRPRLFLLVQHDWLAAKCPLLP